MFDTVLNIFMYIFENWPDFQIKRTMQYSLMEAVLLSPYFVAADPFNVFK